MKQDFKVTVGKDEFHVQSDIKCSNADQRGFARYLKSLPKNERCFFKNCRVKAILPIYMPEGDFSPEVNALNMNKDQLDWFLKRRTDFVVEK
jgi:hypothetical protein